MVQEDHLKLVELGLEARDDALLRALGEATMAASLRVSPPSVDELIQQGRESLAAAVEQWRSYICSSEFRSHLEDADKTRRRKAVIALADVFAASLGMPSAVYASILVLRTSLDQLCRDGPDAENS